MLIIYFLKHFFQPNHLDQLGLPDHCTFSEHIVLDHINHLFLEHFFQPDNLDHPNHLNNPDQVATLTSGKMSGTTICKIDLER